MLEKMVLPGGDFVDEGCTILIKFDDKLWFLAIPPPPYEATELVAEDFEEEGGEPIRLHWQYGLGGDFTQWPAPVPLDPVLKAAVNNLCLAHLGRTYS